MDEGVCRRGRKFYWWRGLNWIVQYQDVLTRLSCVEQIQSFRLRSHWTMNTPYSLRCYARVMCVYMPMIAEVRYWDITHWNNIVKRSIHNFRSSLRRADFDSTSSVTTCVLCVVIAAVFKCCFRFSNVPHATYNAKQWKKHSHVPSADTLTICPALIHSYNNNNNANHQMDKKQNNNILISPHDHQRWWWAMWADANANNKK